MQNPLGFGSIYAKLYWFAWVLLAALYGMAMALIFEMEIIQVVTDAFIFSLFFGVMGQIAWSVVNFSSLERDRLFNTMVTHLVASLVLVILATSTAQTILGILFDDQEGFYAMNTQGHYIRIIAGVGLYSVVALVYYLIMYYDEYQRKKQHESEIENHLKVAELSMLKAQINPHFIFNSLNSVSSLTLTNPEAAHQMVIQLADFLRYSVGKTGEDMQTLESEIKAIELFLQIEKTRFGDRLSFEIDCETNHDEIILPALILQPLIENAVKYGTHESTVENTIRMHCTNETDAIQIKITNHVEESVVARKGKGIGLENVKARLSLVYGRNDLLETKKIEDQFEVKLTIPQNA